MDQRKAKQWIDRAGDILARHWVWIVLLCWACFCAFLIWDRWAGIQAFSLNDTDDNMRLSQVRAWLAGQDWSDLRQHRLNAPAGANIHWSRLVDLPLAGLLLILKPMLGGIAGEKAAIAIAPLLPLLVMMLSLAAIVRRLVDLRAYPIAFATLFYATSTIGMFAPTRIDHHGWQLAMLALGVAAVTDPKRARGGALLGLASALSLAIGLELLIYIVLLGAAMVLFWVWDSNERRRLAAYAASFGGGTALAFLLFASQANRAAVCDALSPVWLSDAMLGGALLAVLAAFSPTSRTRRFALAAGAGAVVAVFHALAFPQCLSRLEGVTPEVYELWLSNVREARPFYRHGWRIGMLIATLPAVGLIGWALLAWVRRHDDRLRHIAAAVAPALVATLLLFWQTRTGPAAQMLAIPGAVAIVWILTPLTLNSKYMLVRTLAPVLVVVGGLGAAALFVDNVVPKKKLSERSISINRANRLCVSLGGLRPVAQQPKGMVFTFVDLGPRLITVTHHNAVAGPYHRNGDQIADVMKAFRGSPEQARTILDKYRADYLLTCPMMSSATIFMAEAPKGFYVQLTKGRIPDWLEPIALPEDSPFKMWRVKR